MMLYNKIVSMRPPKATSRNDVKLALVGGKRSVAPCLGMTQNLPWSDKLKRASVLSPRMTKNLSWRVSMWHIKCHCPKGKRGNFIPSFSLQK